MHLWWTTGNKAHEGENMAEGGAIGRVGSQLISIIVGLLIRTDSLELFQASKILYLGDV